MKISRVEIKVILTKKSHAALRFLTFSQTFLLWLCASWSSDVKLFVKPVGATVLPLSYCLWG